MFEWDRLTAGREFDKTGMLGPWWNPSSVAKFKDRAQCMIDQYSAYSSYGENVIVALLMTIIETMISFYAINIQTYEICRKIPAS